MTQVNSQTCPVCRERFEKSNIRLAVDVETAMAAETVRCTDCQRKVSFIIVSDDYSTLSFYILASQPLINPLTTPTHDSI